jgi:tripartite-type tricarboxylate transporter receptor subunit TctC
VSYTPDDYVPISLANSAPLVFCAKNDFPADDGEQFIELLRENPRKYTYGGDGVGGTVHLAGERIFSKLGVGEHARIIPFGGAGETLKAFLGGHVDIYGGSFPPIIPHLAEGAMKCLLVTSAEHSLIAPDVTSLEDLGVPEVATPVWAGLIAPKGTPEDRIAVLGEAFSKAAQTEEYRDYMHQLGTEAVGSSAAEFGEYLRAEYDAMAAVVNDLGLAKQ